MLAKSSSSPSHRSYERDFVRPRGKPLNGHRRIATLQWEHFIYSKWSTRPSINKLLCASLQLHEQITWHQLRESANGNLWKWSGTIPIQDHVRISKCLCFICIQKQFFYIWFSTWCSGTAYAIHFQANEWVEQLTCKIKSQTVRFFAQNVPYLARRSTVNKLSSSFSMQLFWCPARSVQPLHICSRSTLRSQLWPGSCSTSTSRWTCCFIISTTLTHLHH